MEIERYIRHVPDFPKKGILFYDITPLLNNEEAFSFVIDNMAEKIAEACCDVIAGIDARGFLLAGALAYALKKPLAIVRKKGKLPSGKVSREYALEYAANTLEMHVDAVQKGQRVAIVDDVLATGGTLRAGAGLVEQLGGEVGQIVCLLEIDALRGRSQLEKYPVYTLLRY